MKKNFAEPLRNSYIYSVAQAAGYKAAESVTINPMVINTHKNPLDDNSPVIKRQVVPDGPMGFAWVLIKPANCAFARWLKGEGLAQNSCSGGMMIWVSEFGQSVTLKEAYAQAFAKVLQEKGINAVAGSRLD